MTQPAKTLSAPLEQLNLQYILYIMTIGLFLSTKLATVIQKWSLQYRPLSLHGSADIGIYSCFVSQGQAASFDPSPSFLLWSTSTVSVPVKLVQSL